MSDTPAPIQIYVDADACPVKAEIYRVAERHELPVLIVANSFMNVPRDPLIKLVVVGAGMDVADDWIAERAGPRDIVVTTDVPLASRCVKAGSSVIAPNGRASPMLPSAWRSPRAISSPGCGRPARSPAAQSRSAPRDRSAFLSALNQAIVRLKRAG
jgi:uncharacterized protein YaiI (UPF0178 family)